MKTKKARATARMNNQDTFRTTIKASGGLSPVQGVAVSNYIYSWWSPISSLSGDNSNPLFNQPEFSLYRNLYDQFRVTGLNVKLTPRLKTAEAGAMVQAEGSGLVTYGRGVVYSVEDRDGKAPASIPSLKRYASSKCQSIYKSLSRTYRPDFRKADVWFDCQDPAGLSETMRATGVAGGITIYAESLPEPKNTIINEPWYDIEVTYYVTFKGKAFVNITLGDKGEVCVQAEYPTGEAIVVAEDNMSPGHEHDGAIDTAGNRIGGPTGPTGPAELV